MNDDIQFQNVDSWKAGSSGKFGLTFKQIVLMHINRCVINGSVEWHGGYWNETGYNPTTRTYVHNSRDVYCNSIKMLRACLLGYFDDKIQPIDKQLQEELKKTDENYYEKYSKSKDKRVKSEYYKTKIDLHVRLFEQLIILSKRLNFFDEQESAEKQ